MSDTPRRSGKGAGARADVAPCRQPRTTVEFAGRSTDEANALLGVQVLLGADIARQRIRGRAPDEILVNVTPILLGDGVRMLPRSGRPVRLETIVVCDIGQVTELRDGVRR